MASSAAYLLLRRQKAKRLLEEQVEGIDIEDGNDGDELAVVDSETDTVLATLNTCEAATEPDVTLSFTPEIRVEYQTDLPDPGTRKLQQIKDRLTAAASEWRW